MVKLGGYWFIGILLRNLKGKWGLGLERPGGLGKNLHSYFGKALLDGIWDFGPQKKGVFTYFIPRGRAILNSGPKEGKLGS